MIVLLVHDGGIQNADAAFNWKTKNEKPHSTHVVIAIQTKSRLVQSRILQKVDPSKPTCCSKWHSRYKEMILGSNSYLNWILHFECLEMMMNCASIDSMSVSFWSKSGMR